MCILKISKIMASVLVASTLFGAVLPQAYAGSIGRSSSSSSSSSSSASRSSSSSSSVSRPAQSSSYSAPKQGGIGGNSGSMGVRKSEVTTPVANKVEQKRIAQSPTPTTPTPSAPAGQYSSQQPAYGTPHQPAPVIVQQSSGSPFLIKDIKAGHAGPEYTQGFDDGMFVAISTIEEHFGVEE
jgi:cytoskeletal protein RodZ